MAEQAERAVRIAQVVGQVEVMAARHDELGQRGHRAQPVGELGLLAGELRGLPLAAGEDHRGQPVGQWKQQRAHRPGAGHGHAKRVVHPGPGDRLQVVDPAEQDDPGDRQVLVKHRHRREVCPGGAAGRWI